MISLMTNKISALRAKVQDLKASVGPEVVAAGKKRATDLQTEVERMKAKLREAEQCCKELQKEAEDDHEKMWSMEDELLKLTWDTKALYLDLAIEEDPFANLPEDVNVQMEAEQPFNGSLPLEN
ncbi:hypothetical protein GW17_00059955 [Ensete ventricosum]|nr:hypothetical protein GW17_00059955 [Ensete ventricosum]